MVKSRKTKAPPSRRSPNYVPSLVHEAQVTTLINLAARLTVKAARVRMGAIAVWPGQISLLLWLLENNGAIQKELVQRSGMEQPTVAEHLERMERDGLIYRERGKEDRRQFQFFLSPKGKATGNVLIRHLETGAKVFTKGIPKSDLETFEKVLRQIIDRLDNFVGEKAGSARIGTKGVRPSNSASDVNRGIRR